MALPKFGPSDDRWMAIFNAVADYGDGDQDSAAKLVDAIWRSLEREGFKIVEKR